MSSAYAQDADQQSVKVGEADLYPSLRFDYLTDDNVTRVSDDPASNVVVVDGDAIVARPRLFLVADQRQLVFRASYAGDYSSGSEPSLDWADHRLGLALTAGLGARSKASAEISIARDHEAPGQNITRGLPEFADTPVEFNLLNITSSFTYGAREARGNLIGGLRIRSRSYTNLDAITSGRDFTVVEPFGRFAYRLGGDVRGFAEVSWMNTEFDREAADREALGVFGGLTFTATGRLDGEMKLGVRQTSFDNQAADQALFVAGIEVSYSPTSFATLVFAFDREIDNTSIDANTLDDVTDISSIARVGWQHEWSSRFATDAFVELTDRERSCPGIDTRVVDFGLEGTVEIRRWIGIGATFLSESRTADACDEGDGADSLEFERQAAGIFVRVTL